METFVKIVSNPFVVAIISAIVGALLTLTTQYLLYLGRLKKEWERDWKKRVLEDFGDVLRVLTTANAFPDGPPKTRDEADEHIKKWRQPYWKAAALAPAELVHAFSQYTDRNGLLQGKEREIIVMLRKWFHGEKHGVTPDQLLTEFSFRTSPSVSDPD